MMIGKTLIGIAAGIAFGAATIGQIGASGPASAADLGGGPPPSYDPPMRSNIERWTGFYLGATAGGGFGSGETGGDIGNFSFDHDGWLGTVFAGYNWQAGRSVYGIEADVGTGDLDTSVETGFGRLQSEMNAFGSVRARAGLLLTPALLVYGTGGFAWSNMDFKLAGSGSQSQTFLGYQVGGGAELAISHGMSLRLEYLFTDFGSERVNQAGLSNTFDPDFHTVRAGVAFKF